MAPRVIISHEHDAQPAAPSFGDPPQSCSPIDFSGNLVAPFRHAGKPKPTPSKRCGLAGVWFVFGHVPAPVSANKQIDFLRVCAGPLPRLLGSAAFNWRKEIKPEDFPEQVRGRGRTLGPLKRRKSRLGWAGFSHHCFFPSSPLPSAGVPWGEQQRKFKNAKPIFPLRCGNRDGLACFSSTFCGGFFPLGKKTGRAQFALFFPPFIQPAPRWGTGPNLNREFSRLAKDPPR